MSDDPMMCFDLADNAFWDARDTLQRAVAERTTDPTRDVYERAYYELAAGRGLERRAYKSRMLAMLNMFETLDGRLNAAQRAVDEAEERLQDRVTRAQTADVATALADIKDNIGDACLVVESAYEYVQQAPRVQVNMAPEQVNGWTFTEELVGVPSAATPQRRPRHRLLFNPEELVP
ncbi:hypothetical protein RI054_28g115870 [Pseudoscourfieldia marina]